jgi:hypothetical protein
VSDEALFQTLHEFAYGRASRSDALQAATTLKDEADRAWATLCEQMQATQRPQPGAKP